jgi:hypothetical protein
MLGVFMKIKNAFYAMILFCFIGNSAVIFADDYSQWNDNSGDSKFTFIASAINKIQMDKKYVTFERENYAQNIKMSSTAGGAIGGAGMATLVNISNNEFDLFTIVCGAMVGGALGHIMGIALGSIDFKSIDEVKDAATVDIKKELNKQN